MKMQISSTPVWAVLLLSLFIACSSSEEIKEEELSYQEQEMLFLEEFREKALGDWHVEKMVIAKRYLYNDQEQDTVVYNPGNIHINNIFNDPVHARLYNQLEAYFQINRQMIPFKSRLFGFWEWEGEEVDGVSGLIESNYHFSSPITSDMLPEEYHFLDNYFFKDNYIMFLSEDEKTWVWKGLNRHIREMVLTRN